jgi:hypothetical protein
MGAGFGNDPGAGEVSSPCQAGAAVSDETSRNEMGSNGRHFDMPHLTTGRDSVFKETCGEAKIEMSAPHDSRVV